MNENTDMLQQKKERSVARERRFQSIVLGAVIPALLWWVGSTLLRVDKSNALIDARLQNIEIQAAGTYSKADAKVANDMLKERISSTERAIGAIDDRVRAIEIDHALEKRTRMPTMQATPKGRP
ncbi:hypothetical protein FHW12_000327 [Dokdonella fugitiva]|uniref:Uncharacterized protein n=1 Tax=Dokdonella fugitiva TaxID=328517 RepID=A0A839EUP3_9GAMM|nr:hypothetical protein [Dokdonella fugitiva]MBA8886136.1 hypothetical protein [Dokdonella fugitiva]